MTQKKKAKAEKVGRKPHAPTDKRPPYGRINESVWDIKRRYCKRFSG